MNSSPRWFSSSGHLKRAALIISICALFAGCAGGGSSFERGGGVEGSGIEKSIKLRVMVTDAGSTPVRGIDIVASTTQQSMASATTSDDGSAELELTGAGKTNVSVILGGVSAETEINDTVEIPDVNIDDVAQIDLGYQAAKDQNSQPNISIDVQLRDGTTQQQRDQAALAEASHTEHTQQHLDQVDQTVNSVVGGGTSNIDPDLVDL